jgi:hypothetical protein
VMNRVAEDGVLHPTFQKPHRRFGTTYRIIGLIAALQVVTIVLSRGQIYFLGEAYAFGIVWSFFLKALSVLVLRFQRHDQEYKTPLNFRIAGVEIPLGLMGITATLFFVPWPISSQRELRRFPAFVHAGSVRDLHDF